MAPWVEGGPCANPECAATRAAVWYPTNPTEGQPQSCHLRPCRRFVGNIPAKGRGVKRSAELLEEDGEMCYAIEQICMVGLGNPEVAKLSKKDRRKAPASDDVWFQVLGTFADPDDDDDPGATDLRWLQMEDLGHVSKADVKRAINECEKALMANAKKALGTHQSADS